MGWLRKLFGARQASNATVRRVTIKDPLVIDSPKIGFLNLLGPAGRALIVEDKAALIPFFASSSESDSEVPACHVLMLYARILSDGSIDGSNDGLRTIIRKSGAPIVVVASENEGNCYVAAGKRRAPSDVTANLVMTMRRKGSVFPQFLKNLFEKMFRGKTMPMAWVELAPQIPNAKQENVPATIFAAEISHIVFRR